MGIFLDTRHKIRANNSRQYKPASLHNNVTKFTPIIYITLQHYTLRYPQTGEKTINYHVECTSVCSNYLFSVLRMSQIPS